MNGNDNNEVKLITNFWFTFGITEALNEWCKSIMGYLTKGGHKGKKN